MSENAQGPANPDDGFPGIDLAGFTQKLIGDLQNLREGKISVQQARATAELARQAIRSMHFLVTAQRLIESRAHPINQNGAGNGEAPTP